MNVKLFDFTKLASYFLWEYTRHDNALVLWYCAQDIAHYMEDVGVICYADIEKIRGKGVYDIEYINFVRNISYRVYMYTGNCDAIANWFNVEKLLANYEWCGALIGIAAIFNEEKGLNK